MRNVISFEEFYESIWLKIPEVWRNSDADYGRPLQVLTLTLAQHFYYSFYLKIASMDELFDPDTCPEKYLPFLAATLNWKLLGTDAASWRNQLKHSPLLYKIKGTRKALTIAEKLIGYSVFMTDLYRDYTGAITPKEKIFNNFPSTVKVKPWFRKTSTDISTDIFNDTFSDILPSFNADSGDITSLGSLLVPRKLKKTNTTTRTLSSLPTYDPRTGLGSLARLAKLPRINVVLKKDVELDHVDSTGKYTDANLNEAVDLFLQFKPFHVYINDLLVLYSLSDYVLGAERDKTGGYGTLPGEVILFRESTDIYVTVKENDKISYYNQEQLGSCDADSLASSDTSLFKGRLETKYAKTALIGSAITSVETIRKYGFSLSGYAVNTQTEKGKHVWSASDFSLGDTISMPNSPVETVLLDTRTGTIRYDSIIPEPKYSFIKTPITLEYVADMAQLYSGVTSFTKDSADWYTCITGVSIVPASFCKDTVVVNGTAYDSDQVPSSAWSLKGLTSFIETSGVSNLQYKLYDKNTSSVIVKDLLTGTPQVDTQSLLQAVAKNTIFVCAEYAGQTAILNNKLHYIYDADAKAFIFNTATIADMFEPVGESSEVYVEDINVHILYVALVPEVSGFSVTDSSRNIQIATSREHAIFNRITYVDNSNIQTEIDTAHYTPELEFEDSTGTLIENTAKTKLYREELPRVFTRNSLHKEDTGTPYVAVGYDKISPRDTSKWTVYTEPATALYQGAERLSKTIWANYHNVPFQQTATVPYDSVDISSSAQIANRQSFRWSATLNSLDTNHPMYFLASREDVDTRHALWTRGSASKMARPFIGSSRGVIQGFRDGVALFNRTENLSDYHISLLANYNTDNYKYVANGIDYTDMYRNPTIPFETTPKATTEAPASGKTLIVNNKITYPAYIPDTAATVGYTPQYEGPFDFVSRSRYLDENNNFKVSLYANNVRTDMCPYSGDLLDDFADPVELNVDGLQPRSLEVTISSENDREYVLPHTNIFVSWREVNTGLSMGTGLFPLIDYSRVRPSVRVYKNGIELTYGQWTLASNPNRVLATPELFVMPGDTIRIAYHTLDGVSIPTFPANSITGVPYDSSNTSPYLDRITIPTGFDAANKTDQYTHVFAHRPLIAWYRGDNGAYISVSEDTGNVNIAPLPKLYRDLAYPNVRVLKNGFDVSYGKYWYFTAVPSNTVSFQLVFKQEFTHSLQPNDILEIAYTGIL